MLYKLYCNFHIEVRLGGWGLRGKGGGGRGLSRLDLTVGRFFFLSFGKMSSGWETVEIN